MSFDTLVGILAQNNKENPRIYHTNSATVNLQHKIIYHKNEAVSV